MSTGAWQNIIDAVAGAKPMFHYCSEGCNTRSAKWVPSPLVINLILHEAVCFSKILYKPFFSPH